jgi:hypothetical protein
MEGSLPARRSVKVTERILLLLTAMGMEVAASGGECSSHILFLPCIDSL